MAKISQEQMFERESVLPDSEFSIREKTLIGFETRYERVQGQLRLLLNASEIEKWSKEHHNKQLNICNFVTEQYPFVIFYGDIGTGKTVTAECIANRIVMESKGEDVILFKLSNRVRGSGLVGESSSNLTDAFENVIKSAGKERQAILLIDEGDSIGTSRSQVHSHHEDKVMVNTLIQGVDEFRRYGGRIIVILCTNRINSIDPALIRRAPIVEEFNRPTSDERTELFKKDLEGLKLTSSEIKKLVDATDKHDGFPSWTYSDIRTRLYPIALSKVFPEKPLEFQHLFAVANELKASPEIEDLK